VGDLADEGLRVPRTDVHRGQPPVVGQPAQHPAGDRGLADPADPGQHHPGRLTPLPNRRRRAAQHRDRGPELRPPADQLTDP